MAPLKFVFSFLIVFLAATSSLRSQSVEPDLFYIRNHKGNELHYHARLVNCQWATQEPLRPEWLMFTKAGQGKPPRREPLSIFEPSAYGPTATRLSATRLQWRIGLAESVVFTSETSDKDGRCVVTTTGILEGEPAQMKLAYVRDDSDCLLCTHTIHFAVFGCKNGRALYDGYLATATLGLRGLSIRSFIKVDKAKADTGGVDVGTLCSPNPR